MPKLTMLAPPQHLTVRLLPDDSTEPYLTALYRARIGPVHADYYLPLLTRFEAAGHASLSWNWAAAGCTLSWMVFRGLWGAALVYWAMVMLSVTLLWALDAWLFHFLPANLAGLGVAMLVLTVLLPGLWGNAIFYAKCRKDLARAVSCTPTLQQACEQLSLAGASPQRLRHLLLANVLLGLAVAWVVWFSSLDNAIFYVAKSQDRTMVAAQLSIQPVPLPQTAASAASAKPPAELPSSTRAPASAVLPGASEISTPMPQHVASATDTQQSAANQTTAAGNYLNVGLFADARNAQRLQTILLKAGFTVVVQVVQVRQQNLSRVRVGPFATEVQARTAMQKLHAMKLPAVLAKP